MLVEIPVALWCKQQEDTHMISPFTFVYMPHSVIDIRRDKLNDQLRGVLLDNFPRSAILPPPQDWSVLVNIPSWMHIF